jgi:hypothetical protein
MANKALPNQIFLRQNEKEYVFLIKSKRKFIMLKKVIFTTLFMFSSQLLALSLDDVSDSAETEVTEAADSSISGKAKKAVTEGAKGGVEGAKDGFASGSVVDGAKDGAIDGAKKAISP